MGVKKLPKVKELSIEYAEVLTAKKQAYAEYRQVKNEAQELLIAQRNIASLYDAERKEEEQKRQKENQIHMIWERARVTDKGLLLGPCFSAFRRNAQSSRSDDR